MSERHVMVIRHLSRPELAETADKVAAELRNHGITPVDEDYDGSVEIVIALGGDGTLLGAARPARTQAVPLIGINLGHTGFLTEVEPDKISEVINHIVAGSYTVQPRMTVEVSVTLPDGSKITDWALNEAAIMSTDRAHPSHLGLGIDQRGITTYGADGLIVATPTGSTAYNFSAGGPIVWPDVDAMVVSPLGAHGLFTRPLVVSPDSTLEISVLPDQRSSMELWLDGLHCHKVPPASIVHATKGKAPVVLARILDTPFSGRLVHKFQLPVKGWRSLG